MTSALLRVVRAYDGPPPVVAALWIVGVAYFVFGACASALCVYSAGNCCSVNGCSTPVGCVDNACLRSGLGGCLAPDQVLGVAPEEAPLADDDDGEGVVEEQAY